MAKPIPGYLKLHDRNAREAGRFEVENDIGLAELCAAFVAATGWPLRYESVRELRQDPILNSSAPVNPGVGNALGHLRIDLGAFDRDGFEPRAEAKAAQRLAAGIDGLLGQLLAARQTVCDREADLAAGVPIVVRADEPKQLAARLKAVLKAGAEACDTQAAALYLLDEGTAELKLRAAWGLPADRLMQPARPLEGAIADLEALLGHAVALERAASFGPWRVPEKFPAALCVPVSSPTVPLGTLWMFSDRERDFTATQTNLAEMTAGRLAVELERTMLISAQVASVEMTRQIDAAQRLLQGQLPQPIRLAEEGWELAGRAISAGQLGGAFYDWCWLPNDALAVAVGEAGQMGIAGALTAATLRSAVRTLTEEGLGPSQLLQRINRSLWLTSGGDESASLLFAIIELSSGRVHYSWAGQPTAMRLSSRTDEIALSARPPLGSTTDAQFVEESLELAPTETLLLGSRRIALTGVFTQNGEQRAIALETWMQRHEQASASELLRALCDFAADDDVKHDRAIVAIKRSGN